MNVTRPEINTALLYFSCTAKERNHKYTVVDIMQAREKDSTLYTAWYCTSLIAYITMATTLTAVGPTHQEEPELGWDLHRLASNQAGIIELMCH